MSRSPLSVHPVHVIVITRLQFFFFHKQFSFQTKTTNFTLNSITISKLTAISKQTVATWSIQFASVRSELNKVGTQKLASLH
jgi:hypothetical protein